MMTILNKTESKLQITLLFAVVTLIIISTVQVAQSNPTNTITGIFNEEITEIPIDEVTISLETHSKCGVGTVFEPETYSCVLKDVIKPEEWCGAGTYYNATEHSCLLKKTLHPSFNEHKV